MDNKASISQEDLFDLLSQNEVTNFDPIKEAFKIYDPYSSGSW